MPQLPDVTDAAFFAEARDLAGLPPEGPPEIAIAGRSNVGKSTLLNRLAARRALARTSKTPGRTRGLVMFTLRLARAPVGELRLVDLPGYGYAQVSRGERQSWGPLIEGYTRRRGALAPPHPPRAPLRRFGRRLRIERRQRIHHAFGRKRIPRHFV